MSESGPPGTPTPLVGAASALLTNRHKEPTPPSPAAVPSPGYPPSPPHQRPDRARIPGPSCAGRSAFFVQDGSDLAIAKPFLFGEMALQLPALYALLLALIATNQAPPVVHQECYSSQFLLRNGPIVLAQHRVTGVAKLSSQRVIARAKSTRRCREECAEFPRGDFR